MLATGNRTIQDAIDALREADALTARAVSILSQIDVEKSCGLPAEMMLVLGARRTGVDARVTTNAAATLRAMPATADAFGAGDLSWAQVRAIVSAVRTVDARGREQIDRLIAFNASRLALMDPDELLQRVDDKVADLRADLARAREDRQIEKGFLSIQGKIDGGSSFYGEADAESTATLVEALDVFAPRPVVPDEDASSRGEQHLQGLIAMAEHALNGGSTNTTRPRPRFLVSVDAESLAKEADRAGRILWSLAGRPARLTPLSTEALLCDATMTTVIFEKARPVAVADAYIQISAKLRAALIARDGGCRFPGCHAPVSWCDAHHIRARIHDGPTVIDNLVLLCRRCHRRIHAKRWTIGLSDEGVMEFSRNGRRWESTPFRHPRE